MIDSSAVSRGVASVLGFIKFLLVLALVGAIVGPILWFFPAGGLRSLGHPPVSSRDWLLIGTLLSTGAVAVFLAGVVRPWCDSALRAVGVGAATSQLVVLPFMQFGPDGWTRQAAGWGTWVLLTALGAAAFRRYCSRTDRSWRSDLP